MKSAIVCHHTGDKQKSPQYAKVKAYHNAGAGGKWQKGHGIQYHAFIDTDAEVYVVKDLEASLWHAGDQAWNKKAIAVCLAGDFRKAPPTPEQQEAFRQVVDDLQNRFGIPDESIFNHRDVRPEPTECPGDDLRTLLHDLRLSYLRKRERQAVEALKRIKSETRRKSLTRFLERVRQLLGL